MHNLDLHGWGIVIDLKPLVVQSADGEFAEREEVQGIAGVRNSPGLIPSMTD